MISIIEALDDKHLFKPLFKHPETWAAWRVFLKAVFGIPLDGHDEQEMYRKFTGRTELPSGPFNEVFAICGRRSGKSFISAVIACYLALFRDWKPYLSAGEIAWVLVIAGDRAQARNIFSYVKGILKSSKMLDSMVEQDNAWEITLTNQVGIRIATSNFRTLRGYTIAAAILDELAFWRDAGMNPAAEILSAIRPALATLPGSLLLGISSPYAAQGVLFQAYKDKYGKDEADALVWKAATRDMNPTLKAKIVEKALKDDPAAAQSEWLSEFRSDLETYLSAEAIDAVIIPGREQLFRNAVNQYSAFVDPSGGRRDSFTMAIAHTDRSGRIVLDRIEERKPPFAPEAVVSDFAHLLRTFGIEKVRGDRYGGEWPSNAFSKHGITYRPSEKSKSELYLEFIPQVMQSKVELLDNKRMREQLRGLERRTRGGGKDSVDHFPNGSDDVANVVAGVCVNCEGRRGSVIYTIGSGPGLYWTTDPYNREMPFPVNLEGMAEEEIRAWTKRLEDEIGALEAGVYRVL